MKNWESVLIGPETPLREALEIIDRAGTRMVLVIDANRKLLGTLSDGDVRRSLLRGSGLTDVVANSMHTNPRVGKASDEISTILAFMRRSGLYQMPVVDDDGVVIGLHTIDDMLTMPERSNWVVIMAGGRGTRLAELTHETPKPMLKVGSRPLLETIVISFAQQGFRRIFLSVNYRAEQIEGHFGNGSPFGVDISYLREDRPLGTAGALSLLGERPSQPIVVTNADLLTKESYGRMLDRHVELKADATMAVRTYDMQVPFGVVREGDRGIEAIEEKPIQSFIVNAGMYVLSPQSLDLIPKDRAFDMPSLFDMMMQRGMKTRCHHIEGYWLDIGRMADYERANTDFAEIFR